MATTSLNPAMSGYLPPTQRVCVTAANGMVSCAHPLASLAGLRVLMDGGNAVDASVAMAAVLNVVEPYMSGALGVGQMLVYWAKDADVVALDFGGSSPAAAGPELFAGEAFIPEGDLRAALVPANLGGWMSGLESFGTMDRARVFRDAIEYAANGFPLTEGNAAWIASSRGRLGAYETSRRALVDAVTPCAGAILKQPQLAETYRLFVTEGADALYHGRVGEELVGYCLDNGGLITQDDLQAFEPRWTKPIRIGFRDCEVLTMPSPSMGIQILMTLHIMEGFDTRALGHNSAEYLHTLAEAIKLASADRAEYAVRENAPLARLLSKEYAAEQRSRIDPRGAAPSAGERWKQTTPLVPGHPADSGQTTYLCAADGDGNVVSLTQSLGNVFGCGAIAGNTGLFLNDFAWWFDLDPESPNRIAPNKPVEQCLSPCIVLQDGQFALALGTPGGHGIPQTTTQMLLNALDFGMNIQQAIEAPRMRLFEKTHMDVEARVPEAVRHELETRGHMVTVLPPFHWGVGGGQGIQRLQANGALMGGADPRRDGYALGW